MKTILIAILAVLCVVLAGVLVYQKLTQPEITPIVVSQLVVNQPVANKPAVSQPSANCVKEGDIWEDSFVCCKGLKLITAGYDGWKNSDGSISYGCKPDRFNAVHFNLICSDCGNGICGAYENFCNCPEDCTTYTINKSSNGWSTYLNKNSWYSIGLPLGWKLSDTKRYDDINSQTSSYTNIFTPTDSAKVAVAVSSYYLSNSYRATTSLLNIVKYLSGATYLEQEHEVAGMDAIKTGKWADLGTPNEAYCFFDGNKYLLFCITYTQSENDNNDTQTEKIFQDMVSSFKFSMPSQ